MKKLTHRIDIFSERVANWQMRAAGFAIVVSSLMIGYGVIMRYFFRRPVAWTYEMPSLIYLVITVLTLAYVQILRKHINVDLLLTKLNERQQNILKVFDNIVFLVYCAILIAAMVVMLKDDWIVRTEVSRIPIAPFEIVIIVGVAVLMVRLFIELSKGLAGYKH
ncbi:MAG: TRAP transporter small permease [Chloroflexi bacterium]|nr:TRAP transporter small permease [Chloroflexota bacterium]